MMNQMLIQWIFDQILQDFDYFLEFFLNIFSNYICFQFFMIL